MSARIPRSLPYADDSDAMTIASVSCKAFDDEYGDMAAAANAADLRYDAMYNSVTGSILSTPTNGDWKPPPPLMLPGGEQQQRSQFNGWQNGLREVSHSSPAHFDHLLLCQALIHATFLWSYFWVTSLPLYAVVIYGWKSTKQCSPLQS